MKFKSLTILLCTVASLGSIHAADECNLDVTIDPKNNSVTGKFIFIPEKKRKVSFLTGNLKIHDSKSYTHGDGVLMAEGISGKISVEFEGKFPELQELSSESEDEISERGVSLMGIWYPMPEDLCIYTLKAVLPGNYTAVSEANEIKVIPKGQDKKKFQFIMDSPVERVTLAASSDFVVQSIREGNIEIAAYFSNSNRDMMGTYLKNASDFIKLYEEMLGKYPYRRFAIVENFLPTGNSMPTYTLIGSKILKLPFIPETSLGHEILHQWFGNSVFVNDVSGNWSEGLTTYLADHFYEDMEKRGSEYRKNQMLDYNTFIDSKSDYPPSNFHFRRNDADRTIGYGKVALFFHMLKILSGEKEFLVSLREFSRVNKFRKTSYRDIQYTFEKITKKDLDKFFKSWIEKPGLPRLSVGDIRVDTDPGGYKVTFLLNQISGQTFTFPVYITFYSGGMKRKYRFITSEKSKKFVVYLKDPPEKLQIDESYDTARIPDDDEIPVRISDFLKIKNALIIVSDNDKKKYSAVFSAFPDAKIISPDLIRSEHLKQNCIVLDFKNPYLHKLFDLNHEESDGTSFTVRKNPLIINGLFAFINTSDVEQLSSKMKRVTHYGRYSDIVFDNAGVVSHKSLYNTEKGISIDIKPQVKIGKIFWAGPPEEFPDDLISEKILFMGEQHDIWNHHINQLSLIKRVHSLKKSNMAIGLEMFQRGSQNAVNQFIKGEIKEREFLKESSYFSAWGFDYRLYRDIIEFARKNKIDIIALNQKPDIVRKIAQKGLDSLSDEEKKMMPEKMDLSQNEYRERLRTVFESHDFKGAMNFENFYAAQILWDETMAESLNIYLKNNPDKSLVVLAGNGHFKAGQGIPDRFRARSGISGKVILQDETLATGEADAFVFNGSIKFLPSLFSGVKFHGDDKNGVSVVLLEEKGRSSETGLLLNDRILRVNENPISSLSDFKMEKYFCELNQRCSMVILRDKQELILKLKKK